MLSECIRTERLHLSCNATRMLDTFAAAGHYSLVKGGRLYCQLMKDLKNSQLYRDTWKSFDAYGNAQSVTLAMNGLDPSITFVSGRL